MFQKLKITKRILLTLIVLSFISSNLIFAGNNDIAIVHSYATNVQWIPDQTQGFKNILGSKYNYHEFYMDTKRIPQAEFEAKAKAALDFIKKINPILVYTTDDNALKLVARYVDQKIPR